MHSIGHGGGSVDIGVGSSVGNNQLPFGGGGIGVNFVKKNPVQVVGFIPLKECDAVDRCMFTQYCEEDWTNPVFGHVVGGNPVLVPTYENDISTFLLDYSLFLQNSATAAINFKLEKRIDGVWTFEANLNNSAYGTLFNLNSIAGFPHYAGFQLNWGKVLFLSGAGIYRFKVETVMKSIAGCLISEPFCVRAFDCELAHGTVKFENWLTGQIGDPFVDYRIYNLCNIQWYDSVRMCGFLGLETVDEYLEVLHEWGKPKHGLQVRIRDEAIQKFKFISGYLPKYIHDRFKVYGLMSDTLFGSDYNKNNSDHDIRRKHFIKASNYEPQYLDKQRRRLSKVEIDLKRGVQGVIKSICCEIERER